MSSVVSAMWLDPQLGASPEGWFMLGTHCFGYQPDPTRTEPQGYFQVSLQTELRPPPTDLSLYIFDSQPGSYDAALGAHCQDRALFAKPPIQQVVFNASGMWNTAVDTIIDRATERQWYFVLGNCRGFDHIHYEIRFKDAGFYDEGTGPGKCEFLDRSAEERSLGAGVGILVIMAFVLGGLVARQIWLNRETAKLKQQAPPGYA